MSSIDITTTHPGEPALLTVRRTALPIVFGDYRGIYPLDFGEAELFCQMAVKMSAQIGEGRGFAARVLAKLCGEKKPSWSTRTRASKLWLNSTIQNRIKFLKSKVAAKLGRDTDAILAEAARVAFGNVQDVQEVLETGDPRKVSRDSAAAIESVQVESYIEGHGEDAQQVKRVKLKMHDKMAALDKLMRINGMFAEDNKQLPESKTLILAGNDVLAALTPEQRSSIIAALATQQAQEKEAEEPIQDAICVE